MKFPASVTACSPARLDAGGPVNTEQIAIDKIYREESGRILATLIRLLGSFDLAEEATQEAFAAALEQWPHQGTPMNPRAWLVSTGRNKAVDLLRRRARFENKREELQRLAAIEEQLALDPEDGVLIGEIETLSDPMQRDDRLRLIFTCCHPALMLEAQVALTLRTLCGLATDEIAKAFLVPTPTMARRLVRAKAKIRDARIPYRVPPKEELRDRLAAVTLVVYLVFNEGYNAASGDVMIRRELCAEAIRLGRLLWELLPREAETGGLLALMLLHDSRRDARMNGDEEIVLLEEQNRSLWKQEQIREGLALTETALRSAPPGPYSVQAAIAAVHARAKSAEETDWAQIAALYDVLLRLQPSPVIELNRAVAVAMVRGASEGIRLLNELELKGELRGYYLLPAARGDFSRRLNQWVAAADAYRQALSLVSNDAERRFLVKRLAEAESKME
ncbi:MAG TPA: RNA polymerase sigma factor [Terriglobales bacterium]|jgi:RNA polymerase sigma-70 factor (ECF subfamily)|nr:RNA polymerase sigma factor [Terriglobales bacterium]